MNERDTAALLQCGVTMDTITALRRAGLTTLRQLADRDQGQLADVPGVGYEAAWTIVRALGRLIDAGHRSDWPHTNSTAAKPRGGPTRGEMMGFRRPKPDPKRPDNKTNSN